MARDFEKWGEIHFLPEELMKLNGKEFNEKFDLNMKKQSAFNPIYVAVINGKPDDYVSLHEEVMKVAINYFQ